MELTIEHLPQRHRFQTVVEGFTCFADYVLAGKVITITHTVVPPPIEGRGIAAQLIQALLDHARANGLKVDPQCSYSRAYMQRHPETMDLHV
jgi:uncharacterized protein